MIKKVYNRGEFVKGSLAGVPFFAEVLSQVGDFVDIEIYIKSKGTNIIEKVRDSVAVETLKSAF